MKSILILSMFLSFQVQARKQTEPKTYAEYLVQQKLCDDQESLLEVIRTDADDCNGPDYARDLNGNQFNSVGSMCQYSKDYKMGWTIVDRACEILNSEDCD